VLLDDDIAGLIEAGIQNVMVARLGPDDVPKTKPPRDRATLRGEHVRIGAAFTGRANLTQRSRSCGLDTDWSTGSMPSTSHHR